MFIRRVFSLVVLFLCLAAFCESQQRQIKYVPVKPTSPASGQEMYTAYCAVCHGKEGKGNGPAAEALKVPPPDLTILARKNLKNYPYDRISRSNPARTYPRREPDRCSRAGCRTSAACPAGSPAPRRFETAPADPRGSPPPAAAVRTRTTTANTAACRPSAPSLHPVPATSRANASASAHTAAAGRDRRWRPPPGISRPPRAALRHRPTGTLARR